MAQQVARPSRISAGSPSGGERDADTRWKRKRVHRQLAVHLLTAVIIGGIVRSTTFPLSVVGAELSSAEQQTAFLVTFGASKACTNLGVGAAADRFGRYRVAGFGWLVGLVLPVLLLAAPSTATPWATLVVANLFLGVQQGVTWTTNIFMLIDLLGPRHRALATGLSNARGYGSGAIFSVVAAALLTAYGPMAPFVVVAALMVLGGLGSLLCVRDTKTLVAREQIKEEEVGGVLWW